MQSLLPFISEWFLAKQEHFAVFAQVDSRIEGWLKAELLVLFNRLVANQAIEKFEREAKIFSPTNGKRKQIDFRLHIRGQEHLCEIKALCISQAAGTPRNLQFYFRDDHLGLIKDFKKLDEIATQNKWVMAFIYPSPNVNEWCEMVSSLPRALEHWKPITSPSDFPDWVYIALWQG